MLKHEPKRRMNSKKMYIIFFAVLLSLGSAFTFFMMPPKEEPKVFTLGELDAEQTKQALEKEYKETYEVNDYLFYGEYLNLYKNTYVLDSIDEIVGKSIILKEIGSEQEYSFVLGTKVDQQILLSYLKEGLYEIFIVEELIEKRVIMTSDVQASIKTVSQNKQVNEVELVVNSDMFANYEIQVPAHYAFLSISETTLEEEEYDIAIDPAGNDYDFTYLVNQGSEGHGLIEYIESYQAALLLKQQLEESGLKVLIVREQEEELNSYGEQGRLHQAYEASAKYYIRLGFSESEQNYSGFSVTHSVHASDRFASQILYELNQYNITIDTAYSSQTDGLIAPIVIEGMDGRYVYDMNLIVRESGGQATAASYYSENAQLGTGSFAKDNIYGMYALDINLGYLSNSADVQNWNTNKDVYMTQLASAILSYISFDNE